MRRMEATAGLALGLLGAIVALSIGVGVVGAFRQADGPVPGMGAAARSAPPTSTVRADSSPDTASAAPGPLPTQELASPTTVLGPAAPPTTATRAAAPRPSATTPTTSDDSGSDDSGSDDSGSGHSGSGRSGSDSSGSGRSGSGDSSD